MISLKLYSAVKPFLWGHSKSVWEITGNLWLKQKLTKLFEGENGFTEKTTTLVIIILRNAVDTTSDDWTEPCADYKAVNISENRNWVVDLDGK